MKKILGIFLAACLLSSGFLLSAEDHFRPRYVMFSRMFDRGAVRREPRVSLKYAPLFLRRQALPRAPRMAPVVSVGASFLNRTGVRKFSSRLIRGRWLPSVLAAGAAASLAGCTDGHGHGPLFCDSDPLSYVCTPFNFNGTDGSDGRNGSGGTSAWPDGENGQSGQDGGDGKSVTVTLWLDSSASSVTVKVEASGFSKEVSYPLSSLGSKRIHIRTQGGDGGNGGKGGDAYIEGSGQGGRGGDGGSGGNGGNITVVASDGSLTGYLELYNDGGDAGLGGKGGSGGWASDGNKGWDGLSGQVDYVYTSMAFPFNLIPPPIPHNLHMAGPKRP